MMDLLVNFAALAAESRCVDGCVPAGRLSDEGFTS